MGMLVALPFLPKKLVYKACGVSTVLGSSHGEFGSFGVDEGGFAAIDLFGFEDYLLC